MKRIKTYAIVVLAVLFLIVLIQNSGAATVEFLIWEVTMSRVILFPLILLTGIGIGYLASLLHARRKR